MNMSNNLGDFLLHALEEKGWSQRDLARRAKVDPATVQKIINGSVKSPGIEVLLRIGRALNLPHMKIVQAYEGKDPNATSPQPDSSDEKLAEVAGMLIEALGAERLIDVLGRDRIIELFRQSGRKSK